MSWKTSRPALMRGAAAAIMALGVAAGGQAALAQAAASPPPATGQQALPRALIPVSGNLYKAQNGGVVASYTMVLVTSDGIVMTDPQNPEFAQWLKDELAAKFPGKPVKLVLYTHYHWDHARGGAVFADTAKFHAHETMRKMLASPLKVAPPPGMAFDRNGDNKLSRAESTGGTRGQFDRLDLDKDGFLTPQEINADIVPPDTTFKGARETLRFGDETVVLIHTLRHTDDNVDMYFPKEKVLYVGDYAAAHRVCCNGADFNQRPLIRWINSLKELEKLDFDVAVHNHWNSGNKADLIAVRKFWEDLMAEVQAAIKAGKGPAETVATVKMEKYKDWDAYDQQIGSVVLSAYNNLNEFPGR